MNLAIMSPNGNVYSETFIQAHKKLPFNVSYYFGGFVPNQLENVGPLNNSLVSKVIHKFKLSNKEFSLAESNLYNSIKKNNVNCVLAEYGITGAESLNVLKKAQIPLVVHFHGYDASMYDIINRYKEKYARMFEYADAVIVVSNKMWQDVAALGCPVNKLHLTPCGPNPSFFDVKPLYNTSQFIAIGRFVDKKAPYLTLAAFRSVLEKHPEATLIMVGSGPLLNTCMNLTKVWGIEKSVEFKGALTPAEIIDCMQNSIAFLQHSIISNDGDSEGTPVAVLEASAASLPVIASRHAGIKDVIVNEQTGLLFDELDVHTMASHMLRVLNDHNLAKELGAKGKEHVYKNFTLDKHLSQIATVIEQTSLKQKEQ